MRLIQYARVLRLLTIDNLHRSVACELHHEKTRFLPMHNEDADLSLCFRYTVIVQLLFFLNPKSQASSLFLRLYRPVGVGPCRIPRRPVFW